MSTYVLVHGAWHGSWCWDKVAPLLTNAGHQVITPDLPALGKDQTPLAEVSLKAYADSICNVLDAQTEPVILVGHSMGGIAITQAAEYRPDRINKLVYLTAFLLQDGEFLFQYVQQDSDAIVLPNLVMSEDQSAATVKEEALKDVFYADCSDEDIARAKSLLRPQAAVPFMTPIVSTAENFGRLPRIYIACTQDRAISPSIQKAMYGHLPCEQVISMQTSHSPFFSAPEELARHLLSLAE